MQILIYQDYVENNHVLFRALQDSYPAAHIAYCDADDIKDGILTDKTDLFIMPGGADLYYCEKLNGTGNSKIRDYVEHGGRYLGICAGAYYGCANIAWAEDTPEQAITGSRELAFFHGTARGPVHQFIENGQIEKSWKGAPAVQYDTGTAMIDAIAPYAAGPVFIADNTAHVDHDIIARYTDLPEDQNIAAVRCTIGKGSALLCSFHPEYSAPYARKKHYKNANSSHAWDSDILRKLEQDNTNWLAFIIDTVMTEARYDRQCA